MFIYGRNVIIEALKSNVEVYEINLERNIKIEGKVGEIINLAKIKGTTVEFVDKKKLESKSLSPEHQGVGASINFKLHNLKDIFNSAENLNKSYIYISEATYEHNVGAIIRTAECAGLGGVILPTDIKINPTIIKMSTGAALHIPIVNLAIYQALKEFKQNSFEIIGIERDGESLFKTRMNQPALLIIGGEDKSLSDNLREHCNKIVEIPQAGKVNSLNMSVAAGIIIYEHLRQLNQTNV